MLLVDPKTLKKLFEKKKTIKKNIDKNSLKYRLNNQNYDFLPFSEKRIKYAEELIIEETKMPMMNYLYTRKYIYFLSYFILGSLRGKLRNISKLLKVNMLALDLM